jgi:hypothetical protein
MKHGFLSTPSGQQPPHLPLVDLGFFDVKFREAFKEHFVACDLARMCPWVDIIIGIFFLIFYFLFAFIMINGI